MHITKDEFYEKIKDFKTKEEFEQEIKKLRKEYDDLFDEETIAWLIVDKLGRNTCNTCKITDLTVGMECTVTGVVNSIAETKSFNRKNGSTGKVVNLEISDETGVCRLVLWDKNVELVENNILKTGDRVKIVNGYVKNGLNGVEINVGRWGAVEILTDEKNKLLDNKNNTIDEEEKQLCSTITGRIVEIQPTRAFFRDNGELGFVTNVKLKNREGVRVVTLWGEKVKEIQGFKPGDMVELYNVELKQRNNETSFHLNKKGVIKKV